MINYYALFEIPFLWELLRLWYTFSGAEPERPALFSKALLIVISPAPHQCKSKEIFYTSLKH
jgi:hypothetical protein